MTVSERAKAYEKLFSGLFLQQDVPIFPFTLQIRSKYKLQSGKRFFDKGLCAVLYIFCLQKLLK